MARTSGALAQAGDALRAAQLQHLFDLGKVHAEVEAGGGAPAAQRHLSADLSDADLSDLMAYVSTRPPVDRAMPPPVAGPLMRVLFLLDKAPLVYALRCI